MTKLRTSIVTVIIFSLTLIDQNQSARILGLFAMPGKSHYNMFEVLMKGLAERGHTVDIVTHFPQKKPIPRFNEINIRGAVPLYVNNLTLDFIDNFGTTVYDVVNTISVDVGYALCQKVFDHPAIQQLKNTTVKYDLILTHIFGSDCLIGFAHLWDVPAIGIVTSVMLPWAGDRLGNPDNPSYIPNYFCSAPKEMTLAERIYNTVTLTYAKYGYEQTSVKNSNALMKEFFGPHIPDLNTLLSERTSMIFTNSHFTLHTARPFVPNVVEVGGLHIKPEGRLTPKLKAILDESKNGVIYFSLGSMIRTESFSNETKLAFIGAFADLGYTVLWKGEADKFPGPIPKNIHFETWMPQIDILCHPNVKVFISHGGLLGTQESIYCGVPLLGIPFFADQHLNIRSYVAKEIAVSLEFKETNNKEIVANALKTLLHNPSYKNNVKEVSKLFRDRPIGALDLAIYWIEYVIRHKGAPHLRSAGANLPWYKYFLIDVISILIIIACTFGFILYKLLKSISSLILPASVSKRSKIKTN